MIEAPSRNGIQRRRLPLPTKPPSRPRRIKYSVRLGLTLGLGTGIPLLSLGLSKCAGTLFQEERYSLAAFAGGLCISALTISLPHLVWAVRDITQTDKRAAWALAIAIDLALVMCELVRVGGSPALALVTGAIMASVCIASMILNCWTFIQQPRKGTP